MENLSALLIFLVILFIITFVFYRWRSTLDLIFVLFVPKIETIQAEIVDDCEEVAISFLDPYKEILEDFSDDLPPGKINSKRKIDFYIKVINVDGHEESLKISKKFLDKIKKLKIIKDGLSHRIVCQYSRWSPLKYAVSVQ